MVSVVVDFVTIVESNYSTIGYAVVSYIYSAQQHRLILSGEDPLYFLNKWRLSITIVLK